MSLIVRLAWRNIGRNRRRTALTVAAAVFAVVLVVHMLAITAGVHEKMIDDNVRIHSGHLQVTGAGYLGDRTLERFVRWQPALAAELESERGVVGAAPRVNGFALLSNGPASQGALLIGVDPAREGDVSTLPRRLKRGEFLPAGAVRPIVLGERLAHSLRVDVGDEILVYTVAYTLENAYELFAVSGVMRLPEANLDRTLAVIALADAQALLAYDDRVSEVALRVDDAARVDAIQRALSQRIASVSREPLDVNPWPAVLPELQQMLILDDVQNGLMLAILVVVVAFGILNTILMSVLERQRELGVMLALGLPPRALFGLVYVESLLLSALGLALGLAIALPAVAYLQAHPIPLTGSAAQAGEMFGFEPVVTWKATPWIPLATVALMTGVALLAAFYPAVKAAAARPVDALRSL
jgi:ABC-type lipoprotein release transport system permease subunit